MPEKATVQKAKRDLQRGKRPSTAAGEFVREEIEHIREGKHGARSTKQVIAIGLSKARRAGVNLRPPKEGKSSASTRQQASRDYEKGRMTGNQTPSPTRSRATRKALQREGTQAASHAELSRQAKASAKSRSASDRSRAARKAVATKGPGDLKRAAQKAARTRTAGG